MYDNSPFQSSSWSWTDPRSHPRADLSRRLPSNAATSDDGSMKSDPLSASFKTESGGAASISDGQFLVPGSYLNARGDALAEAGLACSVASNEADGYPDSSSSPVATDEASPQAASRLFGTLTGSGYGMMPGALFQHQDYKQVAALGSRQPATSQFTMLLDSTATASTFGAMRMAPKRKVVRVKMACIHCRKRKIKCSGDMPCRSCSHLHRDCRFGPVPIEENEVLREKKKIAREKKKVASVAAQKAREARVIAQAHAQASGKLPIMPVGEGGPGMMPVFLQPSRVDGERGASSLPVPLASPTLPPVNVRATNTLIQPPLQHTPSTFGPLATAQSVYKPDVKTSGIPGPYPTALQLFPTMPIPTQQGHREMSTYEASNRRTGQLAAWNDVPNQDRSSFQHHPAVSGERSQSWDSCIGLKSPMQGHQALGASAVAPLRQDEHKSDRRDSCHSATWLKNQDLQPYGPSYVHHSSSASVEGGHNQAHRPMSTYATTSEQPFPSDSAAQATSRLSTTARQQQASLPSLTGAVGLDYGSTASAQTGDVDRRRATDGVGGPFGGLSISLAGLPSPQTFPGSYNHRSDGGRRY